jgi:hypothetical protein
MQVAVLIGEDAWRGVENVLNGDIIKMWQPKEKRQKLLFLFNSFTIPSTLPGTTILGIQN